MAMKKVVIISFVFLFSASCTTRYKVRRAGKKECMSLDEALSLVNNADDLEELYDQWRDMALYSGYLVDYDEDGEKLDRKMNEYKQKRQAKYEKARREQAELEQAEYEREKKAKYEHWKKERAEFIRSGTGSLKDKTAQEVKRLVDRWIDDRMIWLSDKHYALSVQGQYMPVEGDDEHYSLNSLENFYKVFGKPQSTQFLSAFNCYYFWYVCKDGKVQIEVDADRLDHDVVYIAGVNIF